MTYIQYDLSVILQNDDLEAFKNYDFYTHPDALYFTDAPECGYILQAVQNKAINIVGYLIGKYNCHIDENLLHIAVLNDDLEMVKLLVDKGQPIDGTAFQLAAQRNNVPILQYFVDKKSNPCFTNGVALSSAAVKGSLEAVKFLIDQGCPPNSNDNNPIMVASKLGQDKVVEFLLEYDQVVQAPNILSKLSDKHKDLFLQKTLLGPTMALHGVTVDEGGEQVRLPIYMIEKILDYAYNTESSIGIVDAINRIQSVYDVKK